MSLESIKYIPHSSVDDHHELGLLICITYTFSVCPHLYLKRVDLLHEIGDKRLCCNGNLLGSRIYNAHVMLQSIILTK